MRVKGRELGCAGIASVSELFVEIHAEVGHESLASMPAGLMNSDAVPTIGRSVILHSCVAIVLAFFHWGVPFRGSLSR